MSKKNKTPSKKKEIQIFNINEEDRNSLPETNFKDLDKLLLRGRYDDICRQFMKVLHFFQDTNYRSLNVQALTRINDIVTAIFSALARPDFKVPQARAASLLVRGHLFANLVAMSSYKSTDGLLANITLQEHNFTKILFLYTARNQAQFNQKTFFDADPVLASIWFYIYPLPQVGCVTAQQQTNMLMHYRECDSRYTPVDHRVSSPYFYSTYFGGLGRHDVKVKQQINAYCKNYLSDIKIVNKPKRDSILVVTSKWFPNSAVFKSCSPLLDRLRGKYKLTLAHTDRFQVSQLAYDYFDKVERVNFVRTGDERFELTTTPIAENDFQLAYFPDIGMTDESVWLSNLRLAPIQVASYGHPVSTFGSEIDYFVVGEDAEKIEDLEKNYSECPIVLPGLGVLPSWPQYERKHVQKTTEKIIGNCVWGPEKFNHTLVRFLQEIATRTNGKFQAELFSSRGVNRYNAYIPLREDLMHQIGAFATLHSDKEYMDYMATAELGDFAINSWPFGGYNTVVEALYLGKPVVTLEGDRFYNLAASALLRKVGLDDLITHTAPEFVDKCVQLVMDPSYLAEKKERLESVDLREVLFNSDEPLYFERAIEHLIDNHSTLKGLKEPIYATRL